MSNPSTNDEQRRGIWITAHPDSSGVYHPQIELGPDHVVPLVRTSAMAWVWAVLEHAGRAQYDAAVFGQMVVGTGGQPEDARSAAAAAVEVLRGQREPIDDATLEPFGIEPGVSAFTGEPFLTLSVAGQRVGSWTPRDAVRHVVQVLESVVSAELDTVYRALLVDRIGLVAGAADACVDDLARYRAQDAAS